MKPENIIIDEGYLFINPIETCYSATKVKKVEELNERIHPMFDRTAESKIDRLEEGITNGARLRWEMSKKIDSLEAQNKDLETRNKNLVNRFKEVCEDRLCLREQVCRLKIDNDHLRGENYNLGAKLMAKMFPTPKIIHKLPAIKQVYFNDPVTVVIWADDTKTIVRTQKNDTYDPEKGLAMAISKKALGNDGGYYDEFKKWLPKKKEIMEKPVDPAEGEIVNWLTIKEAADILDYSEKDLRERCKKGIVRGAVKENGKWKIPAYALK